MIGDTGQSATDGSFGPEALFKLDQISGSPSFDWRFVFCHTPGYSHCELKPFTPDVAAPATESWQVRSALFSTSQSIADASRHVTLFASGHNHQYEQSSVQPSLSFPPGPLPHLVIGRAGPELRRDFPWTVPVPPYVEADRDDGLRVKPLPGEQELEGGWLGYAIVVVGAEGTPSVARIRQYVFTDSGPPPLLTQTLDETLMLQER